MTLLFLRRARVTVAPPGPGQEGRAFENLRIAFRISKTIDPEPNKAFIEIYNLSKESRERIFRRRDLVKLDIAYGDAPLSALFFGEIRYVDHNRKGGDWISKIECGDGDAAWRDIIVNKFSGPNTSISLIFQIMRDIYDIEIRQIIGNIDSSVYSGYDQVVNTIIRDATSNPNARPEPSAAPSSFLNGITLRGIFGKIMTRICDRAGLNFFINNQTIYIVQKNAVLVMEPIRITPNSGLIGSPKITETGGLAGRSLILPGIIPGREIIVESEEIGEPRGQKLTRIDFSGDTYSDDWYADFESININDAYSQ